MQQMLLPSPIRFDILRHVGYSRQELQTAAKQVSKIRERRQKSSNELAYKIRRWLKSRKVLNKESTSHT